MKPAVKFWRWIYMNFDGSGTDLEGQSLHKGDGPDPDVERQAGERQYPVVAQRFYVASEVDAYIDGLEAALAEARANDRTAMAYLADIREALGGEAAIDQMAAAVRRLRGGAVPCDGCSGRGVVGGWVGDGYDARECEFCNGFGTAPPAAAVPPSPIPPSPIKPWPVPPAPVVPSNPEKLLEVVSEAVAEALGDAYDCTRVWSAWSYGTMGPDDFSLVREDQSRVAEIADAVMKAMKAAEPAPVVPEDVALLDAVAANHWRLDPFDMPTGCGDADVGWRVVEYNMPGIEREVAFVCCDDPRAAIRAAMLAAAPEVPR